MEFIYEVNLEVRINNIEAGILYKFLQMHPQQKHFIQEGKFGYELREFEDKTAFDLILTDEVLNSCLAALEDQESETPLENILKSEFLEKIYNWMSIIDKEESIIEEFRSNFYSIKFKRFEGDLSHFSFKDYWELQPPDHFTLEEEEQKESLLKKIKRYF
ncbi:hypothetical protein SAMN05443633_11238 [Chryseobacterium arachidis]|uniref:Uncharacterized protein n=1 Tax=Chryseobacterium arachidis TaxID=1416778 RepID=A0A1M5I821_9FLAO|nr:hypothetical protein [Chryseobacterium arachidis]SHG24504.1 hypothetical protein SAMN05443633_11238 [Chryseobacterium arachidis]